MAAYEKHQFVSRDLDPYQPAEEDEDSEEDVEDGEGVDCLTRCGLLCHLCASCIGLTTYCLQLFVCCFCLFLGVGAIFMAQARNYSCNEEAVSGLAAPYNGDVLPSNVMLKEYWNQGIQWTKQIDVYDPAQPKEKIGSFFDMNFFFFNRFGYADSDGRVWFEARRPWFYGASSLSDWWRRHWYAQEHYYLQRCDSGFPTYNVDEDISVRPWWCADGCMKIFNVSKSDASDPLSVQQETPEARVHFNYTLEWYFDGFRTREAWNMRVTDASKMTQIASAQQTFTLKNYFMSWQQRWISHWEVKISKRETNLPSWVLVFMAALDDIDESSEEDKSN